MPKSILNSIKFGHERYAMADAIVRMIETYNLAYGPQFQTWETFIHILIIRRMFAVHQHDGLSSAAGIAKAIGMPRSTVQRRLSQLIRAVERRGTRYAVVPEFFNTPNALQGFKRRLAKVREADKLIWSTTPDGATEYHTPRYLAFFDLPAVVLDGQGNKGWMTIVHPKDRAALLAKWETARRTGNAYEARARMRCYDGEYRWFVNRATPGVRGRATSSVGGARPRPNK